MPVGTLADTIAVLVATLVPGIPLALLVLRRARPGLSVVLVVAAGLGLVTWMAVGIPAVHHGFFTRRGLVVAVGIVTVASWSLARRHVDLLRPRRPGWLAAVLAVMTGPALALRDDPVYFAYQVADFGEYVNRANVIADGGPFGGYFVNGFPLLLGESHLLLGEAGTVRIMPFVGLLLAAGILATLRVVGTPSPVIAAVGLALAVHVHPVWFSQFPASESLYATLLVFTVLLATCAARSDDLAPAAAGGAIGLLLVIVRGNGLVFLPLVVAALPALPVLVRPASGRVLRVHLLALAGGLWLGSLYDARYNPTYFLDAQAAPRLPDPVADWFVRLDEPLVAAGFTVVVALGLVASVAAGALTAEVMADEGRRRLGRRAAMALVLVGVLAAHVVVISNQSFLPRYEGLGVWIGVTLLVALAVWFADAIDDDARRFAVGWPLLVGVVMATFQAGRLLRSISADSQWFLYWDRYFFSETFPMILLAGGVALGVIWDTVVAGDRPWSRPAALGGLVALVVVGTLDTVGPTRQATERAMFADTYDELETIDRLMPEDIPIVYDGLRQPPEGWFWSNSVRVVGSPLAETFDRRILNMMGALKPDPTPDTDTVVALVTGAGGSDAYVLQVSHTDSWPALDAELVHVSVVGTATFDIERLEGVSARRPEDQRWIDARLHIRVLRVEVRSETVP